MVWCTEQELVNAVAQFGWQLKYEVGGVIVRSNFSLRYRRILLTASCQYVGSFTTTSAD